MRTRGAFGSFALFTVLTVLAMVATVGPALAQDKSLIKEIQQRGELPSWIRDSRSSLHLKDSATGQWKGIAVDIMEEWAKELGVKHVAVDTSWDTMIAGLQAGKYDVAASLNQRPARALVVTFAVPYMYDMGTFAVNRAKIQGEKLRGARQEGREGCRPVKQLFSSRWLGSPRYPEILRLPDQNEMRIAVLSGRAPALMDDISGNAKFASENKTYQV